MQSIKDDYIYDSINAAISRDDVATLLYIWTRSFREGKEGIIIRQLIDNGVKQIAENLGYSTSTFPDLVRRWYWDEISSLLKHDFPSLIKLLRDTPYRAPSDAFVQYYPLFGGKFTSENPIYASDLGRLIYYLCLKSEKKEGLEGAVGLFVKQVTEALDDDPTYIENVTDPDGIARQPYEFTLQALYELCRGDEWYEPIYILCRALLPEEGRTFDLEITLIELASRYEAPEAVLARILRDIMHSSAKEATIAKILVIVLQEECCEDLIKNLIREEASTELLYVLASTASLKEVHDRSYVFPEDSAR